MIKSGRGKNYAFKKYAFIPVVLLLHNINLYAQQTLHITSVEATPTPGSAGYYGPGDSLIEYTGRIEIEKDSSRRAWSPGVYMKARFRGSLCEVFVRDEVLYGNSHNYIEMIIDSAEPMRMQTR